MQPVYGPNLPHSQLILEGRQERRREPRHAVNCDGVVRVIHPFEHSAFRAVVTDLSRSGMGLLVDRPLLEDVVVQVRTEDLLVLASVRHCTGWGERFLAGTSIIQMLRKHRS